MSNDLTRLLLATSFAADQHRDQRRKDAEAAPYINHPIAVANVLATDGGVTDVVLLSAALLHDTVEDTNTSFDQLSELFGNEISDLVGEVTDDKSLPKQRRKQMQIETATTKSDRAKQLKIADKICNVRDINANSPSNWSRERKLEYLSWAQRVVAGCRGVNDGLDRLIDQVIADARDRLAS